MREGGGGGGGINNLPGMAAAVAVNGGVTAMVMAAVTANEKIIN